MKNTSTPYFWVSGWSLSLYFPTIHSLVTLLKISLHDLFCQCFSSLLYVYLGLFSLPFKIKCPIQVLKNFCGMVTQWLSKYFTFYNMKVSSYLLSKKKTKAWFIFKKQTNTVYEYSKDYHIPKCTNEIWWLTSE